MTSEHVELFKVFSIIVHVFRVHFFEFLNDFYKVFYFIYFTALLITIIRFSRRLSTEFHKKCLYSSHLK